MGLARLSGPNQNPGQSVLSIVCSHFCIRFLPLLLPASSCSIHLAELSASALRTSVFRVCVLKTFHNDNCQAGQLLWRAIQGRPLPKILTLILEGMNPLAFLSSTKTSFRKLCGREALGGVQLHSTSKREN